jgi:hypothetical protein
MTTDALTAEPVAARDRTTGKVHARHQARATKRAVR